LVTALRSSANGSTSFTTDRSIGMVQRMGLNQTASRRLPSRSVGSANRWLFR